MKRRTDKFDPNLLDEFKKNVESASKPAEEPEVEEDPEEAERKRKEANLKKLGLGGPGGPGMMGMGMPMMGGLNMANLRGSLKARPQSVRVPPKVEDGGSDESSATDLGTTSEPIVKRSATAGPGMMGMGMGGFNMADLRGG